MTNKQFQTQLHQNVKNQQTIKSKVFELQLKTKLLGNLRNKMKNNV